MRTTSASQISRLAIWRAIETRADKWTSLGAFAVGVTATAAMLLF